ncbi:stage II sporulation protein M [Natronomonas sp. EA1]|uniref:stage II sporulation protein M n=1 Tax=Natronomonas sp. EA1 TaxID=3421655 RepID=UPI003EBAD760
MSYSSRSAYQETLIRSRLELLASVSLFGLGVVLGATVPSLTEPAGGLPTFTVEYFLRHNTRILFGLWLGAPLFGIPTVLGLVLNGSVFANAVATSSIPIAHRLALLFPHVVFELPGIFVAGCVGLKPFGAFVRYLVERQSRPMTPTDVRDLLRLAVLSLVLIAVAGALEALVTPSVVGFVTG